MRYALVILILAAQAQAATLYVSPTGSHTSPFSGWTAAATNIQSAINAASAGDTILVAPGIYNESVTINKNLLTVQGGNGTLWDADRTIIDRQGAANSEGVTFIGATNSILLGVTVMGTLEYGITVSGISNAVDSVIVRGTRKLAVAGTTNNYLRNSIVVGNYESDATSGANVKNIVVQNCIIEANGGSVNGWQLRGCRVKNSIYGYSQDLINLGGNITNNTTNSVCQQYSIAPASVGVGTNLVWAGVASYIPSIVSLAQGAGVGYTGINAAKSGDGGPALIPPTATALQVSPTLFGGAKYIDGSPLGGNAISFTNAAFAGTGGTDYGDYGVQSLGLGANFTVEFWLMARRTNNYQVAWSYGSHNTAQAISFWVSGSALPSFMFSTGPSIAVASPVATNVWNHYSVSVSNRVPRMFLNGVAVATTTNSATQIQVSDDRVLTLGLERIPQLYYPFNGMMSEFRVWGYARSAEQTRADYTNRVALSSPGLLLSLPLDGTEKKIPDGVPVGPLNLRNPTLQPTFMEAF